MKISCQSCNSKYNVADDKVQGKIVKIRCRKCGATIVVNASGGAAANGSTATAAPSPGPAVAPTTAVAEPAAGADGSEWHVSISDTDQRTMTLADLVIAYNNGVVVPDTFIWTDGMEDWKPLSEVDVVVAALHAAAEQPPSIPPASRAPASNRAPAAAPVVAPSPAVAAAPYEAPAPVVFRPSATVSGGFSAQAASAVAAPAMAPAPEPKRAAVKREQRSRDLFATRTGEELRTSASMDAGGLDDARLTGQRNENSVLFSLEHLTKSAEERSPEPAPAANEDSGIIDLKALAAKAESMRPPVMAEMNVLSAPLGYTAPLGAPLGALSPLGSDARPKSKLPLVLGIGAGGAVLVVGIVIGLKFGGAVAPAATVASGVASAAPSAVASSEPAGGASSSATAAASASAAPSSSVAATTPKPRPYAAAGGGQAWHPGPGGGGAKPGAGGGAMGAGGGAAPVSGGATPPPSPKKNDCNCNGDLMCMMKCSTHQ